MARTSARVQVGSEGKICMNIPAAAPAASRPQLPSECRIADGLYIGNIKLALQVLRSDDHMGVTHVLSLVSSSILSSMCSNSISTEQLPLHLINTSLTVNLTQLIGATAGAAVETAKQGSAPLLRLVIPLMDSCDENILHIMQPCFEFIDQGRQLHGTVLVHCVAGQSRSAAVVLGYLMKSMGISLKQAMHTLNRNYKKACPNTGFMRQLQCLERQLHPNIPQTHPINNNIITETDDSQH